MFNMQRNDNIIDKERKHEGTYHSAFKNRNIVIEIKMLLKAYVKNKKYLIFDKTLCLGQIFRIVNIDKIYSIVKKKNLPDEYLTITYKECEK